jgi:ADP-heptose:LPS heptosyltransferase
VSSVVSAETGVRPRHERAIVTGKPRMVMLRALGLGDFLAGVPAYRALARAFPGHYRVLAAPLALAPLARLCGGIDEVVDTAAFERLDRDLNDADVAVNLHGCGPQSHRMLLDAHPRRFLAFEHDAVPESSGGPPWEAGEHEVRRWCRLLRAFGIEAEETDLYLQPPSQQSFRETVLLHCGAASESRRWPAQRWIDLASRLRARNLRVLLTGTPAEFRRCRFIAKAAGIPMQQVVAGKTGLLDLCSLVAASASVICGDTGVAHLATALRTPSVVLFGPTPPSVWGPPEAPEHRVIWRGQKGDPHADCVDPGLASITVDEVMREFNALPLETRAS